MSKIFLLISLFFVSVLVVGSVSAVSADLNTDGCVSLGEISNYVSRWLTGQITLGTVSSGVGEWLGGC